MVRVVEAQIARFYKVFVEDENNDMTDEQILAKAKEMILEDESNFELEEELEVEEQDIIHLSYLYCLKNRMSLIDFDEWCYICDVLNRDIPFSDVSLMNKYVLEYNEAHGTDHDWSWMEYPQDNDTRTLFENMIAFGHEKEV